MELVARGTRHDRLDDERAAAALLDEQTLLDKRANALLHRTAREVQHRHELVLRGNALVDAPLLGVDLLTDVVGHLHIEQGGVFPLEVRHAKAFLAGAHGACSGQLDQLTTTSKSLPLTGALNQIYRCEHIDWSTMLYLQLCMFG